MEWVRGDTIGRGSFGIVSLAIPTNNFSENPASLVVKSTEIANSVSLQNEKQVLSELGNSHPHVVQFLGDCFTSDKGAHFYNLFFEYASRGSLADHLSFSGGKFEMCDVRKYTKSILKGLCYIHEQGFIHCDIKLQNVLLFDDGAVKIADFGLAGRVSEQTQCQLRGTPLLMSPEIVAGGEVGSPADIWALGCAVVEMVTGNPVWGKSSECDVSALLYRIGVAGESPKIPQNLCPEGKDFLEKCLAKDSKNRWSARMLLDHPFLSGLSEPCCSNCDHHEPNSMSPRCPFEFSDWELTEESNSSSMEGLNCSQESDISGGSSILRRFEQLGSFDVEMAPNWSDKDGWINVR